MTEKKPIPCGGCGATKNEDRCLGCFHDFGTPDSQWVHKYTQPPKPAKFYSLD